MTTAADILKLSKQLYPTGRAMIIPADGTKEQLHTGLGISEAAAYDNSLALLDSILPDNANFTDENADSWYRKLGIVSDPTVPLDEKKAAILRKMQHPGTIPARQHFLYLERELQLADFDVFVFENRFVSGSTFITKEPDTLIGVSGSAVHSPLIQHGQVQHGATFNQQVVNNILQAVDGSYDIGTPRDEKLRATFFVGADPLGDFASVPAERESEFRQLILKLKPVHTLAYLFVNYV